MNTKIKSIRVAACALATSLLMTGCFTRETTTINTPALYNVDKDASGALKTNLVAAASVKTIVKKERLALPEGYAAFFEDDMFGMKLVMNDSSSTMPNIIMGEHHGSARYIPVSTNPMYAPTLTVNGSIDNKAVPFWISSKGSFTSGNGRVTQTTDTNGTSSTASTIVPGTPVDQTK